MKKFLKILAVAAIAVAAAIACIFVGCKGGNGGGDGKSDYNFSLVYEDGGAVNGQADGNIDGKVFTQICLPGADCHPLTLIDKFPDANGKLSLSQAQVNQLLGSDTDVTTFVFHACHITGHKDDCEITVTQKGDYTLVITVS